MEPNTQLNLCNIPYLDRQCDHTLTFNSLESQENFFRNNTFKVVNKCQYLRQDNAIKVEGYIEDFEQFNYLFYVNKRKVYYCFIVGKEYVNERTTKLYIETDLIQTYLFDFIIKASFVERMHVNRWLPNGKPTKEVEPENLETGEYEITKRQKLHQYKDNYIIVSTTPLGNLEASTGGGGGGGGDIPLPPNPSISGEQKEFIEKVAPSAMVAFRDTNFFASVNIAQAIEESAWGKSTLATKGNNLFGIKANKSWIDKGGKWGEYPTKETINGVTITIMAKFRHYDSWDDSMADHIKFLTENPRYKENGVFDQTSPKACAECLYKAGYATNPNYATNLMLIINGSKLTVYDIKG